MKDSPCPMGSYPQEWVPKIKELLIPGSVLDIGCNTGRFYDVLRDHKYTGVDINQEVVDMGRKLHPDSEWITADINDFKWKDYDNIFSWVSTQHIKNPPFEEMKKHAKNIIFCECISLPEESNYQFPHDYKKNFPGIKDLGSMVGVEGSAHLMNWRKDGNIE
jgi:SAM-dependent methyltransferase